MLQAEVRLLEAERRRLLRDLALKADLEAGYARRGAAQGAALKQARARADGLEGAVARLLADFQRERAEVARRAEEQVGGIGFVSLAICVYVCVVLLATLASSNPHSTEPIGSSPPKKTRSAMRAARATPSAACCA